MLCFAVLYVYNNIIVWSFPLIALLDYCFEYNLVLESEITEIKTFKMINFESKKKLICF